jgi:hypothetical protein
MKPVVYDEEPAPVRRRRSSRRAEQDEPLRGRLRTVENRRQRRAEPTLISFVLQGIPSKITFV